VPGAGWWRSGRRCMTAAPAIDLARARLRANPRYVLHTGADFPGGKFSGIEPFAREADFFGVLLPANDTDLRVKAISDGDALLFLTLQQAACVPAYFWRNHERFEQHLWQLVLDRVLELEVAGEFRSGPELSASIVPDRRSDDDSISNRALRYAATLPIDHEGELAGRLYFYNRIPAFIGHAGLPVDRPSTKHFLGIGQGTWLPADSSFLEIPPSDDNTSWLSWGAGGRRREIDSPFKLYLCVYPDELPAVFRDCLTTCAEQGAFMVKVGADRYALRRPDKFVAYFNTRKSLDAAARQLGPLFAQRQPHALPFAGTMECPLLAWGCDPPKDHVRLGWSGQTDSWRTWVVHRLAAALAMAKREGCSVTEAAQFSRERVGLEGVDVETWAPQNIQFR